MAKAKELETVTIDVQEAEKLHAADDLITRIEEAEEECASAFAAHEAAKAEAKLRKECYEGTVAELRKLARARKECLPLFDGQPGSWRAATLIEAGLSMELAHPLTMAGIDTFGDLVNHMRTEGGRWFSAIRGVGEEKAGVIADLVAKFWAEHPEAAAKFEEGGP